MSITDFATIDRLDLELAPGFNVLTGETGAGKSLIVDALGLLLGGRSDATMVRSGAPRAMAQGIFALDERTRERVADVLGDETPQGEGADLIVSREVAADGRSVCRINGRIVPLRLLSDLGQRLGDIHGQGQHLSLLRVREHADILDRHGGLWGLRTQVGELVGRLRAVRRELAERAETERETARRRDLLHHQSQEIGEASLRSGEDADLARERSLLGNAEQLVALADQAYRSLYGQEEPGGGSAPGGSAIDALGAAAADLARLERLDPTLAEAREAAEALGHQAAELSQTLRAYRDGIEHSPQRLHQVEDRLELLSSLKRKYGDSIEEVLDFGQRVAQELDDLSSREERLGGLRAEEADLVQRTGETAARLSAARRGAADGLASDVEAELRELAMEGTWLGVAITQQPSDDGVPLAGAGLVAVGPTGADRVEFEVSPNPGEPLRPLARTASGGETARLMLAVKVVLSNADHVPILVFDEVDAGVGGRTAAVIGQKLSRLGSGHQVLCVTHLPQIACFADRHIRVDKSSANGRVTTTAWAVGEAERVDEIAQMLGGGGATARHNAQDMLERAARWKSDQPAGAAAKDDERAR